MGRATQGVRLINLKKNDEIAAIAKVQVEEELEDEVELDEEGNPIVVENTNENNETQAEETPAEDPNNE